MSRVPGWKVYNPQGEYVAACKHPEDAACLVAVYGDGASIKWSHYQPVWTEGQEDQPAEESYDHVAETCRQRLHFGRWRDEARSARASRKVRSRPPYSA